MALARWTECSDNEQHENNERDADLDHFVDHETDLMRESTSRWPRSLMVFALY